MREISAGVIIYKKTKDGPKFLLLYHGKSYWNFAKGKIEKDERSFRAALREVKEETGLHYNALRFKEWFKAYDKYVFMRESGKVFKLVIFYLAETTTSKVIISEEHEGYGWFSYKDTLKLLRHENSQKILRRAYNTICGKGLSISQENPKR